ncbi:hypothetical protein CEXT_688431 [Caerostris extrusa]|uniref:Uncharacterized protein n=1 Tax=Caerostris extrusa TaxID=172846 RepID=A0AAV4RW24_CAEEX|nr:hypothetical protein CEXT_688431 [Caerostris extrusa]
MKTRTRTGQAAGERRGVCRQMTKNHVTKSSTQVGPHFTIKSLYLTCRRLYRPPVEKKEGWVIGRKIPPFLPLV